MPTLIPRSLLEEDLATSFLKRREQLRSIARRAGVEEPADLVQESFLKALEADHRSPVEKPLNFLRRIARNLVVDRGRATTRAGAVFSLIEAPDSAEPGAGPERTLIASQRLARALAIIDGMPPRRREVFLLHRVEEITYAQCAARLGISIKTVEKHITEAMAQLSREIDKA